MPEKFIPSLTVATGMGNDRLLAEANARNLKAQVTEKTIAVVIFGACENHGDHMPFGSDFIMPYELATRLARRRDGLVVLPPVPYGVSSHHKDFFMTITLEPETMIRVIQDVLQSLVDNGVKRILIINGHDGNIGPIEVASRKVKEQNSDAVICCLESWWTTVGRLMPDVFEVWQGLGHGGEAETSAMLEARPDLVDMKLAPAQVVPKLPENVRIFWKFSELTNTGATGAPDKATAEKGRKIMAALEDLLLDFIAEMDRNDWKYGRAIK
jgi:creatinine amidohydrolase